MITTKSPTLNWLFRTPLRASAVATLVSLLLAAVVNGLFLSPATLTMTLFITLVIAAPMSYLTINTVIRFRVMLEDQKFKLALEHERAEILAKFMRDAAHEFKTPLTLMSSNLYLMDRAPDPVKKQAYTENTNEQIQTLNTLLETILILTRLDSTENSAYQLEVVEASELLSDTRSFDSTGRIKLLAENGDKLPRVHLNITDFHLVLTQIIGNALRYSPAGSQVTVQLTTVGQQLVLQITDQGQGMNTETIAHIFDRFYRKDASHTTRGLGLGLAIAKRVIELHNGHIEVQSEVGKGTTVKVFLPIA
jgi:signal transduction histidine kinase